MDAGDFSSWTAALIAAVACGASIYYAHQSRSNSKAANETAVAALERSLRTAIASSQAEMTAVAFRVEDQGLAGKVQDATRQAYLAAVEAYLNAHEAAAMYYCKGMIDYDRYKSEYRGEIKIICDQSRRQFAKSIHPEDRSEYVWIWKVYRQFWG